MRSRRVLKQALKALLLGGLSLFLGVSTRELIFVGSWRASKQALKALLLRGLSLFSGVSTRELISVATLFSGLRSLTLQLSLFFRKLLQKKGSLLGVIGTDVALPQLQNTVLGYDVS